MERSIVLVGKGEGGSPCPAGSSLSAHLPAARPSWAAIRSRISNKRSQSHWVYKGTRESAGPRASLERLSDSPTRYLDTWK